MAATLILNGQDSKPLEDHGIHPPSTSEVIRCAGAGCEISYTFVYGNGEIRMHGNENVVDLMQRTATELLGKNHPAHLTKTYLWKGPDQGWKEADSIAARRSL